MKVLATGIVFVFLMGSVAASELTVVSFNLESGADTDPVSVSNDLARIPTSDLWALSEVQEGHFEVYRRAIGHHFELIGGTTGRADRLAIVFDPERLEQLGDHVELAGAGGTRHPLMVKFGTRSSGKEFFFVANHLQRGKTKIRRAQARWLNRWAQKTTTKNASAIVLAGDFNFDFDPVTREGNRAYELFLERDVFRWVEPQCLSAGTCPSTGTQCNPKYNSILDFVFLGGGAKGWKGSAVILLRRS